MSHAGDRATLGANGWTVDPLPEFPIGNIAVAANVTQAEVVDGVKASVTGLDTSQQLSALAQFANGPSPIALAISQASDSGLAFRSAKRMQYAALSLTPTLYFDASKTSGTSTGAGTLANPAYTLAQLQALVPGDAKGVIVGFARGVTIPFEITLTGASSRAEFPFTIIPYGDPSLPLPLIDTGSVKNSWTLYDAVNGIYTMPISRAISLWQIIEPTTRAEKRITQFGNGTLANKLAKLITIGAGYYFWDSGSSGMIYCIPHNNANPINTSIIVGSNGLGYLTGSGGLNIQYTNQATSGNIVVFGIATKHSGSCGINVKAPASAGSISSIGRIAVGGCDVRHTAMPIQMVSGSGAFSGSEVQLTGGGSDGIVVYGINDSIRTSVLIRGNYIQDCGNNAVELCFTSRGYVEYNESLDTYSHGWAELYACNSNTFVQHNKSFYDTVLSFPYYNGGINLANPIYCGGLLWLAGFDFATFGGTLTQAALNKSSANTVRFNTSFNCPCNAGSGLTAVIDEGTPGLIFQDNIVHIKAPIPGAEPIKIGRAIGASGITAAPSPTVDFQRNVVAMIGGLGVGTYPIIVSIAETHATPAYTPVAFNSNVYFTDEVAYSDHLRFRINTTWYGGGSGPGTSGAACLAEWVAGTGFDTSSAFINPMVGSDGSLPDFSTAIHVINP